MTSTARLAPQLGMLALAAATASAQDTAPREGLRPLTVEDVLSVRSVTTPELSPDGRWVVYVVTERDLDRNANDSDLWLVSTEGGTPRRLTFGSGSDASPAWSADGSWIAFRSDRGERAQVYGIRPDGGEAWAVTDHETGVGGFVLSPGGGHIAFVASRKTTEEDTALEKARGRPIVWDSSYTDQWNRLWVAPVTDGRAGEAVPVSADDHYVGGGVWSPNGERLAYGARSSPVLRTAYHAATYVVDATGGEAEQVTTIPGGDSPVAWTEALGLVVGGSGQVLGTYNTQLWRVPLDGGDPVSLTSGLDENASFVRATDRALFVEAAHRTGRRLYRIPLRDGVVDGSPVIASDDRAFYAGFSITPDGARAAFVAEGGTTPPDVYASSIDDFMPSRLTYTNPQLDDVAFGAQRVVTWASSADGEQIEGVLTLPLGYREGLQVPLLLVIHGGPSGVSSDRFAATRGAYPVQVFAGMGYAVLQPNYRGSTGYGERFRGLNRGDISGRDWIDIDSGVDALIERGVADPDRLGIMGWSFGGHHTYWGITQTTRYRAASAGAGANDLISMYSQTDIPEFYHTYLGPKPWEDFELYEERSAYRYVTNVTTPLLIQVGERDERVPAEQSIQFYEAVKAIGKAPVQLVLYPGQPHGVRDPRLTRDLMNRNVEWFERWIPMKRDVSSR